MLIKFIHSSLYLVKSFLHSLHHLSLFFMASKYFAYFDKLRHNFPFEL